METKVGDQFLGLADNIVAYLPSLLAGIILVLIGLVAGWIIKKILVQISVLVKSRSFPQTIPLGGRFCQSRCSLWFI